MQKVVQKSFLNQSDTKHKISQPSSKQKRAGTNDFRDNADDDCLIS